MTIVQALSDLIERISIDLPCAVLLAVVVMLLLRRIFGAKPLFGNHKPPDGS